MAEPPITIRAAHDSGPGNGPITRVVIHATCPDVGYSKASAPGTAHGTALYFATQAAGGSAHYVCGVDGEEHCVPEDVIAWHAPPNPHSLGIEITAEGGNYARNYTREQWLSPEVWPAVQRAAARVRDLCDRHGIPLVKLTPTDLLAGKRGICGHVDVSQAWHQSTHTDPGPNFPWAEFMAEVTSPQGGFLMALSDAEQTEIRDILRELRYVNPPFVGAKTPLAMAVGDIFVHTRQTAAAAQAALAKATAMEAALEALATSKGADPAAIQQAVTDAVDAALKDLKIVLSTDASS